MGRLRATLDVLREAGELLLAAQSTAVAVSAVDAAELTTSADLESERLVMDRLSDLDPAPVISEEADRACWQARLRDLARKREACWILDPLDGSGSFAEGDRRFGVQLARVESGQLVGGWIVCPALGWELACVVDEEPHLTGTPATRAVPRRLADVQAVVASGDFSAGQREAANRITSGFGRVRGTRSCAVDYAELAAGLVDIAVFKRTLPWDHAPGVFVTAHMGFRSRSFDGSPYRLQTVAGGLITTGGAAALPGFPDLTTLENDEGRVNAH